MLFPLRLASSLQAPCLRKGSASRASSGKGHLRIACMHAQCKEQAGTGEHVLQGQLHGLQSRRDLAISMASFLSMVQPCMAVPRNLELTEEERQVALEPYTDPDGLFRCLVPKGWRAAQGLEKSTGILASWYNPDQPGAETLAIFSTPVDAKTTQELGSAKDEALSLANAAPNSLLLGFSEATDEKGQVYYIVRVEFDGTTAGMFGSAIETRNVIARDGIKYFLRVTTTRYRYLAYKEIVERVDKVAASFQLLA